MISVVPQQVIAARNRIVDAWIEDLLAAHEAPAPSSSRNQRPLLPKFHPSPVVPSDETRSSFSHALHPTNRRGKRKAELHLLQNIDPNMNPTPKRGAANAMSRKNRRKSAKTEKSVKAQGEETPRPEPARVTRSASTLAKAESLDNPVHLPPPLDMAYTSAIDTNAALASGPGFGLPSIGALSIDPPSIDPSPIKPTSTKPPSTKGPSGRSKSPVKSMVDLSLTNKPIQSTEFGAEGTQLPLDVGELYEKLWTLSNCVEILPTVIKVSTLTRQK
jgi:hypothetical protein